MNASMPDFQVSSSFVTRPVVEDPTGALSASGATIWTVDRDLMITSSVGAGLRIHNLESNSVAGNTLYAHSLTADPNHPAVAAHLRALDGESARYEGTTGGLPTEVRVEPLRDEHGDIQGCIAVSVLQPPDVHAASLQRGNEVLLRQVANHIDMVVWLSDQSLHRVLFVSQAFEKIWGRPCSLILEDPEQFIGFVLPEDRALVERSLELHRDGQPSLTEYRIQRPDGTIRWIRDSSFPIVLPNTGAVRVAGIAEDITTRKMTQDRLMAQRHVLEQLATQRDLYAVPSLICKEVATLLPGSRCILVEHGAIDPDKVTAGSAPAAWSTWFRSEAGLAFLSKVGVSSSATTVLSTDALWNDIARPSVLAHRALSICSIGADNAESTACMCLVHAGDDFLSSLELEVLHSFANLASIAFTRMGAAERQEAMNRELDHRVKNNLATVLSLARQSAHGVSSVDEFLSSFQGRLISMGAVHEQLADAQWTSASLEGMVRAIVIPMCPRDKVRRDIEGEPVSVSARMASGLALILHELVTNASQHGVFLHESGRLVMRWSTDQDSLTIRWREVGGLIDCDSIVEGFGLTMARGLVEHQLRGHFDVACRPEGLDATIRVPLVV